MNLFVSRGKIIRLTRQNHLSHEAKSSVSERLKFTFTPLRRCVIMSELKESPLSQYQWQGDFLKKGVLTYLLRVLSILFRQQFCLCLVLFKLYRADVNYIMGMEIYYGYG